MKKNLFTQVEFTKIKGNQFDLSHDVKMSLKFGKLYPTTWLECVPGDKFNLGMESLVRMAPMVAPPMHRMDVTAHWFFVPNRIIWDNWENYITDTKIAGVRPAHPTIRLTGASPTKGSLLNYLGLPEFSGMAGTLDINALPLAAYQAIWNEYYRDQNLITEISTKALDGNNAYNATFNTLRTRAWEHDYFTSCLPTPQKNAPVDLPLGTLENVPVLRQRKETGETGDTMAIWDSNISGSGPVEIHDTRAPIGDDHPEGATAGEMELYAKTEDLIAEATTISDLRRAFKLQEWLEKAMRGGSRYIEFIKSMFGVTSSDKRLQRPEYITGVKSPLVISEVLNTTGTEELPQGNMAGHGVAIVNGNQGSYYCEEHGIIMCIMSVTPKTSYQQGVDRKWSKITDPFEYYFEQFAHIGEQAVLNKEIYVKNTQDGREEVFGYIPRYSEYKFENSRVAGDFMDTLDIWTLTRQFATPPSLNQTFIECVPDTRIFAVEDGTDYLFAHIYHKVNAFRKMPFFGSPKF